jgi:hypothetical protein
MIGLYRAGRRIQRCIREWTTEDDRSRRDTRGNDECLDAKASPKVLDGIAVSVGSEIPLIPRKPKRRVGHLDNEEVEIGVGRQAGR